MRDPGNRVLIASEDIPLRARLTRLLRSAAYDVELVGSCASALSLAARQRFKLAILALSNDAPTTDVQDLKRRVGAVLTLSADPRRTVASGSHVVLSLAATDEECLQQVRDLTKASDRSPPLTLSIGKSAVNLQTGQFIDARGREMSLTPAETALIKELAEHAGSVRSRDQLRRAVSGRLSGPFDRSVDMLITRLRNKLEPNPRSPIFIVTVPRVGYKLGNQDRQFPANTLETVERRQLTILSCSVAHWPSYSFTWDPEELISASRQFKYAAHGAIETWGGTVVNSTGDRCIAHFCYPETTERDAEYAVCAALALLRSMRQVATRLEKALDLKIGIATGLVAVTTGDPAGKPVVAAAALREAASQNCILVDTHTRRLLHDRFDLAPASPCAVPEISEPLPAFQVLGEHLNEPSQLQLPPAVHGRQSEVQRILDLWKRVTKGRGQVVVVSGEPGIGKSHLCAAFLRRIANDPHRVIEYNCSSLLRNRPLHPVKTQVEKEAELQEEDSPNAKLEKVKWTIFKHRPARVDELLMYGDLLSDDGKSASQSGAGSRIARDRLLRRLARHVSEFASETPTVLIVSDSQWADSSTLDYIDRLVSDIRTARLLLLFQCRPEFSPSWLGAEHVTILSLDRLSREQSLALISSVAGATELPAEIKEQIAFRSDGVPLYLEEITKGAIESIENSKQAAKTDIVFEVPETLFGSIAARLDRLGAAKQVAQAAATIGVEWPYSLLESIVGVPRTKLGELIQRLLDSQIILLGDDRTDGSVYRFKHNLTRESAYATLPKARRAGLHGAIADALLERAGRGLPIDAEVVAYHCSQAQRHRDAQNYWQRSADYAAGRGAHKEAIRHLNEAVTHITKLPEGADRNGAELSAQTKLGNSVRAIEGWTAEPVKSAYMRALQLCTRGTPKEQVVGPLFGLWSWHFVRPEIREALHFAEQLMSVARSSSDQVHEVLGRQALGFTYFAQGRFGLARQELGSCVELCRDHDVPRYLSLSGQDPRVHGRLYCALALSFLGASAQASEVCAEALDLARRAQDPFSEAIARTITLRVHQLDADAPRVAAEADAAVTLCEEFGFSHYLAMALVLRGWARAISGEIDAGIAEINSGLQRQRATGACLYETYALGLLADACIKGQRYDQSLGFLGRALQLLNRDDSASFYGAEIYRLMAETRFRLTGCAQEAAAWLSQGLALAHQQAAERLHRRLRATWTELFGADRESLDPREEHESSGLESMEDGLSNRLIVTPRDTPNLERGVRKKLARRKIGRATKRFRNNRP